MANYTQTTDFSSKDNLATGNASKVIKGSEVDAEFSAIATAISSKIESSETVIPAGTIMLFLAKAVPSGWSLVSTWNQKSLLLNSSITSSNAYTTGGNWAIGSGTLTMQGSLPNHTHSAGSYDIDTSTTSAAGSGNWTLTNNNDNVSGNSGNPNTTPNFNVTPNGGNMNNGNWRPAYVEVISCSKD